MSHVADQCRLLILRGAGSGDPTSAMSEPFWQDHQAAAVARRCRALRESAPRAAPCAVASMFAPRYQSGRLLDLSKYVPDGGREVGN